MMKSNKNKCKYCGGNLLIEYIGSYGSVYRIKKNGEPSKRRLKKIIYGENDNGEIIYCEKCGKQKLTD